MRAKRLVAVRFGSALAAITDSRTRIIALAAFLAIASGLMEYATHLALFTVGLPPPTLALLDALVIGCGFGLFTLAWLLGYRARRQFVVRDLARIAELNHRVRNALQVIVGTLHGTNSEQTRMIHDSVNAIDATLRELFPSGLPPQRGAVGDMR
jgi:hypothetical protein